MKKEILKSTAIVFILFTIAGNNRAYSTNMGNISADNVLRQIQQAKTVSFRKTFEPDARETFSTKIILMKPGYIRMEDGSATTVINLDTGRSVELLAKQKHAILRYMPIIKRNNHLFEYMEWVDKLSSAQAKLKGQEEIGGRKTNVFVMAERYEKTTVWVDPNSNLPVQVEMLFMPCPEMEVPLKIYLSIKMPGISLSIRDFGGMGNMVMSTDLSGMSISKKMRLLITDFVWDEEIAKTEFSPDIPREYLVEDTRYSRAYYYDARPVIDALVLWLQMTLRLPREINEMGDPDILKHGLVNLTNTGTDPAKELELAFEDVNRILRGLMFAQQLQLDGNWLYLGDRVIFGMWNEPICFWRLEGLEGYRLIYSDFSIGQTQKIPWEF